MTARAINALPSRPARIMPAATGLLVLLAAFMPAGCQSDNPFDLSSSSASTTPASGTKRPVGGGTTASPTPSGAGVGGVGGDIVRGVLPGVAGEPEMRVRLAASSSRVLLSGTNRMVWVAPLGAPRQPARMQGPVAARTTASGWELTDAAGLIARFDRGAIVAIAGEEGVLGPATTEGGSPRTPALGRTPSAVAATSAARVTVDGKSYAGLITLVGRSDGTTFDVINRLPLEEYLKGVVSSEMFSGWPLAAYQAQAVAARSYAISERTRSRALGAGFDVESDVRDQAYKGGAENPIAARAVTDTRGVVLTWNGDVLRAYYSSTCGGRPAAARDTWPTGPTMAFNLAGPLQGQARDHACQAASYYRWTVVRPRAELTERMRAFGREAGHPIKAITGIESIRPAGVNAAGRTNRFLVVQAGGQSFTLTGEELRRAANTEIPGRTPITAATRLHSSDTEVVVGGTNVTFSGRGFGHGVGLCQWCAKGFADRGESFAAVLARFYPGARLERVY